MYESSSCDLANAYLLNLPNNKSIIDPNKLINCHWCQDEKFKLKDKDDKCSYLR